ncbi:MAG: DUF4956 domain-containing protein [Bacteroidota bacterium]
MNLNIKLTIGILLFQLIFIPSTPVFSQETDESVDYSISKENTSDNVKKKKKDNSDEDFFQIDKLSEKFFIRLLINLIAAFILIRLIYYSNYKKKELFFTYFTFNFIIFLITYFLNKVDMGIGAAFGMFAVFSMLRYRTENISAKDMTYLFLAIAIGLLTAISKASSFELALLNALILLITFCLEGNLFLKKEFSKTIRYENIELIKPEHHSTLITDLKNRTGLNIHRIAVDKVDFLKDTARVTLYYYEGASEVQSGKPSNTTNTDDKIN